MLLENLEYVQDCPDFRLEPESDQSYPPHKRLIKLTNGIEVMCDEQKCTCEENEIEEWFASHGDTENEIAIALESKGVEFCVFGYNDEKCYGFTIVGFNHGSMMLKSIGSKDTTFHVPDPIHDRFHDYLSQNRNRLLGNNKLLVSLGELIKFCDEDRDEAELISRIESFICANATKSARNN